MNKGTWTFYILFCTAVLGLAFLAGFLSEYERLPEQGDPLGGSQGIQQLDQWKSDGTNITQQTANKPLKLTGLTPGGCLELTAGNVATTTGSPCLASASGGLATTSIDTESDLESILTDVTNVFTNNDGALSDDDLTNNSIEDLSDVSAITETYGDLLYWNGASWADIATSSLSINFTDLVGSATDAQVTDALTISSSGSVADGALSANVSLLGQTIGATELASADFGDWTCNGTTCALDADTVADSEIDYSAVTLADFTNDADFVTWASATSTLWRSTGLLSNASSTIGSGSQGGGLSISGGATTTGFLVVQGTATSTFAGPITMQHPYYLTTHGLRGDASDGLSFVSTSFTQVANFGAGGGSNATFYGGVNIDGATRLATSLTGVATLSSGTVAAAAATTCTNQFVRAMSAAYVATCASVGVADLASADFGDWTCNGSACTIDAGAVDFSNDTNAAGGRSITLNSDAIDADAELYTDGRTYNYASSSLATSTRPVLAWKVPQAFSIATITCSNIGTGTTTVQFEERTTLNGTGTDVLYSPGIKAGDIDTASSTVSNSAIASGAWLVMVIEGYLIGTPTNPVCDIKGTYDD